MNNHPAGWASTLACCTALAAAPVAAQTATAPYAFDLPVRPPSRITADLIGKQGITVVAGDLLTGMLSGSSMTARHSTEQASPEMLREPLVDGRSGRMPASEQRHTPVPSAAAQQDRAVREDIDIVVTAQRQPYLGTVPVRDMPQAMQTVDRRALERSGVTRLPDALDLVSGIARQNSFGGLWDSFAVRGFAGDINVPSGLLVNGFNYGRGFGGPRDLSGVDRIEVLKGPSSALFGRGEPGGTVNIITLKPQFTPAGSAAVQGGSFDTYRIEGDYTGPLSDRVAVRINGALENGDSFRDTIKTRKRVVSPSVLWKPADNTSLSYQFSYTHQEIPLDRGVVAVNGKLGVVPISRFLGEPADGPTRTNDYGHQLQLQQDFSENWGLLLGAGYRKTSLKGFSEWPELLANRQPFFTDGRTLSRQRRQYDYDTSDLVLRAEVNGKAEVLGMTHNLLVGADYDRFVFSNRLLRSRPPLLSSNPSFAQLNAIDIYDPVYVGDASALPVPTAVVYDQRDASKSWGVYVQDQIDVTDRLKVRLGGRYDNLVQTIRVRATGATIHQEPDAFSPQVGLVYQPVPELSVYASYGKGFRANTGNDFYGNAFAPERTEAYEIGVKYASNDGAVTASLAAYTMSKNNILTADPVHQGNALAIGTARSKGVEFDADARLGWGLRAMAALAYVDAYSTSTVLDPDFGRVVGKGDRLINIPKFSGNLLLFKDFRIGNRKASLGGGVTYAGRRLGETGTTFTLPAYTLTRLLASADLTDHLEVSGEINNLFDKTWYANSAFALWVYPGTPRNFTVRMRYRL